MRAFVVAVLLFPCFAAMAANGSEPKPLEISDIVEQQNQIRADVTERVGCTPRSAYLTRTFDPLLVGSRNEGQALRLEGVQGIPARVRRKARSGRRLRLRLELLFLGRALEG
ncbi:MAG: hypothetical protein M3414_00170, partial [Pseudomonadota bacterium]|nr:hypothetical protein [Pseudomonadota bacterium]